MNSGCVYSNIDNESQNPTFQLLSVIGNMKAQTPITDLPRLDIITFCMRGQTLPLNNWEDPHYFTFAVPCLFLFRTRGHLDQRKRLMSLET